MLVECLIRFADEPGLKDDQRLLGLWLRYVQGHPDASRWYALLIEFGVGQRWAQFWIEYAGYLRLRGLHSKVNSVFLKALALEAQPLKSLLHHQDAFLKDLKAKHGALRERRRAMAEGEQFSAAEMEHFGDLLEENQQTSRSALTTLKARRPAGSRPLAQLQDPQEPPPRGVEQSKAVVIPDIAIWNDSEPVAGSEIAAAASSTEPGWESENDLRVRAAAAVAVPKERTLRELLKEDSKKERENEKVKGPWGQIKLPQSKNATLARAPALLPSEQIPIFAETHGQAVVRRRDNSLVPVDLPSLSPSFPVLAPRALGTSLLSTTSTPSSSPSPSPPAFAVVATSTAAATPTCATFVGTGAVKNGLQSSAPISTPISSSSTRAQPPHSKPTAPSSADGAELVAGLMARLADEHGVEMCIEEYRLRMRALP